MLLLIHVPLIIWKKSSSRKVGHDPENSARTQGAISQMGGCLPCSRYGSSGDFWYNAAPHHKPRDPAHEAQPQSERSGQV
ncbi:hypothetical protein, partial [Aeromonas sp. 604176]|uniref:hypothetical protein n=1 Tax=Aeromonas sp. 604176 TaxID=2712052 RepID=UPI003BA074FA